MCIPNAAIIKFRSFASVYICAWREYNAKEIMFENNVYVYFSLDIIQIDNNLCIVHAANKMITTVIMMKDNVRVVLLYGVAL